MLLVVWYGGLPLALLVAVAAALGAAELFDLAERRGYRPARAYGIASAAALPLLTWLALVPRDIGESLVSNGPYLAAIWLIFLLTWALARALAGRASALGRRQSRCSGWATPARSPR